VKSQRHRKESNARINKVLAMEPDLAKIIEKVHISRYFDCAETDLHIAENARCMDYANTWSSKRHPLLSKCQCPHRCTSDYGWEDPVELDPGVARALLPIT